MNVTLLHGDSLEVLKGLSDESIQTVVTSPPYFGLRSYLPAGHQDKAAEIGTEETPAAYIARLTAVFTEVQRVLRKDGTLWVNIGDSYARTGGESDGALRTLTHMTGIQKRMGRVPLESDLKPKDLIGIPWMLAFALRAEGWYLRQDIIWCLSGGTMVYARTQKGDMPLMLRDVARLDPATVKLWNGEKWTQVLGWSRSSRTADEVEIVLRSGERISCTPNHKFPTQRGLIEASDLCIGDRLTRVALPAPETPRDSNHIWLDAAWLAGLYLAEGSRSGSVFQIAGHVKEDERWERVKRIVESYGGSVTRTIAGNKMDIRIYGRVVQSVIDHLVCGTTAKNKGLTTVAWRYSNEFLRSLLDGYLSGDGHWEEKNRRWRLGFTRNYAWERDLRTLAARLGIHLVLNLSTATYQGGTVPTFRGELRFDRSGHWNEEQTHEVAEIRKARCREVYDVGVEDEPHLFALASGILTHNSKPNAMPESVTDRCTKAHEYVFLLSKSPRYYYDAAAIAEPATAFHAAGKGSRMDNDRDPKHGTNKQDAIAKRTYTGFNARWDASTQPETRNKRSVWSIATKSFDGAHFAVMPEALVLPCILAGSRPGDTVLDPFMGSATVGAVSLSHGRSFVGIDLNAEYLDLARSRLGLFAAAEVS